jgi:hypothetical protein
LFLDALFDEALLVLDISPSWEVLDRLFARNGKNGFGGGFEFGGLSRERAILIHGGEVFIRREQEHNDSEILPATPCLVRVTKSVAALNLGLRHVALRLRRILGILRDRLFVFANRFGFFGRVGLCSIGGHPRSCCKTKAEDQGRANHQRVTYLHGWSPAISLLEPFKPFFYSPPNRCLKCHPVNRVEIAVISGPLPIDTPPHGPTIKLGGIDKPLKSRFPIHLFQSFQFRLDIQHRQARRFPEPIALLDLFGSLGAVEWHGGGS